MEISNKEEAFRYYGLGFNVSCISYLKTPISIYEKNPEKSPSHDWKDLQIRHQRIEELENYLWDYSTGIGTILGSTGIVCIDIDECFDFDLIKNILEILFLPEDYEWIVKTPNGFHIYIKSTKLNLPKGINNEGIICVEPNEKNKGKFKRVEFRYAGHAVLPESIIKEERYFFLVKNLSGGIKRGNFPSSPPKNVTSLIVFSLMAYLSGEYRTEYGYQFLADFSIGGYDFKFSQHSSGQNFEINKEHIKLYEWNYSPNDVTTPKIFESILYIDLKTDGSIIDLTNYDTYPKATKVSFLIESYRKKVDENESIKTSHLSEELNFDIQTSLKLDINSNSKKVEIKYVLDLLSSKINESNILLVMHDSDFKLSIFDSEYKKLGKRNPLRDKKNICIKQKYSNYNGLELSSLDEIYENFFNKSCLMDNGLSLSELEKAFFCYKLMEICGYFDGIPRTIMNS